MSAFLAVEGATLAPDTVTIDSATSVLSNYVSVDGKKAYHAIGFSGNVGQTPVVGVIPGSTTFVKGETAPMLQMPFVVVGDTLSGVTVKTAGQAFVLVE